MHPVGYHILQFFKELIYLLDGMLVCVQFCCHRRRNLHMYNQKNMLGDGWWKLLSVWLVIDPGIGCSSCIGIVSICICIHIRIRWAIHIWIGIDLASSSPGMLAMVFTALDTMHEMLGRLHWGAGCKLWLACQQWESSSAHSGSQGIEVSQMRWLLLYMYYGTWITFSPFCLFHLLCWASRNLPHMETLPLGVMCIHTATHGV